MKLNFNNTPPAVPIMTHPGIEIIGKRIADAVTNGNIQADAVTALAEKTPSDAATMIMDLTVEAEAFGCKLRFSPDNLPSVENRLLQNAADVTELRVPDLNTGRVNEYLQANRSAARRITDRPVYAGCIGPFSLAGRLYDITEIMMALFIEPDMVKKLLIKCSAFIMEYVKALKDTGVDGVIMAEPVAGLLSNEDAMTFSTYYIRPIVDSVQDDNFLVTLHNCGNTGQCTQSMIATGAGALSFGNRCDIVSALDEVPADRIVMGNLDPVRVFKDMSPENLYDETMKLLTSTAAFKNFVISTGCDVPAGVSHENINAFFSAIMEFRQQKKR